MTLIVNSTKPIRAAAAYIRLSVFVLERGIALTDEFDDKDSDDMIYAVLFKESQPIATCRFEQLDATTLKIGRVATLKAYRGHGYGRQVITAMENRAKEAGLTQSIIHSELTAQGFYEKMGYRPISDVFLEDGVPCIIVKKDQL
ncbi:N-acetyltransferase [Lentilactobacillus fungorum]|jgi:predicted GNAT family N-acyltransferase|uniref:N-acetyltransferase n=1 Tax=Lentilactobacillus fungorum TaxID=2201250 RepID=A0ABQ3VXT0_9LACO|nr:GNAT family N-acetyltransferase [Lentilactobacillus fungorum]GHP13717.1 N-acetyltransferase [Lentilactobacillus fungorum]